MVGYAVNQESLQFLRDNNHISQQQSSMLTLCQELDDVRDWLATNLIEYKPDMWVYSDFYLSIIEYHVNNCLVKVTKLGTI